MATAILSVLVSEVKGNVAVGIKTSKYPIIVVKTSKYPIIGVKTSKYLIIGVKTTKYKIISLSKPPST